MRFNLIKMFASDAWAEMSLNELKWTQMSSKELEWVCINLNEFKWDLNKPKWAWFPSKWGLEGSLATPAP